MLSIYYIFLLFCFSIFSNVFSQNYCSTIQTCYTNGTSTICDRKTGKCNPCLFLINNNDYTCYKINPSTNKCQSGYFANCISVNTAIKTNTTTSTSTKSTNSSSNSTSGSDNSNSTNTDDNDGNFFSKNGLPIILAIAAILLLFILFFIFRSRSKKNYVSKDSTYLDKNTLDHSFNNKKNKIPKLSNDLNNSEIISPENESLHAFEKGEMTNKKINNKYNIQDSLVSEDDHSVQALHQYYMGESNASAYENSVISDISYNNNSTLMGDRTQTNDTDFLAMYQNGKATHNYNNNNKFNNINEESSSGNQNVYSITSDAEFVSMDPGASFDLPNETNQTDDRPTDMSVTSVDYDFRQTGGSEKDIYDSSASNYSNIVNNIQQYQYNDNKEVQL